MNESMLSVKSPLTTIQKQPQGKEIMSTNGKNTHKDFFNSNKSNKSLNNYSEQYIIADIDSNMKSSSSRNPKEIQDR